MSPSWLEILGSLIIIVIGIFYLLRIIYNYKLGKKIWKVYNKVSRDENLEVKKSLNLLSDWPNLYGEIEGGRVYVHPDRGGRKNPSKTIFAVENKIELPSDLIINTSEINQPKDTKELDIKNINKFNLNIYSKNEIDEKQVDYLFTGETTRKIKNLINRNEENFRAIILESGLAMFSVFKINLNEDNISNNIEEFYELVTGMEEEASNLNKYLESQRMIKISEGTKTNYLKGLIPLLLFGVGGYLLYQVIQDFSFLFLNAAVIAIVTGAVKLYVFLHNEWIY